MDWGNLQERNLEFEKNYHFQFGLDYDKELESYNEMVASGDDDGRVAFVNKHKGMIAFFGKIAYYHELMKAGIL